ncbi:MAG TPA: hypothetical protein VFM90_01435 [Cyclobacteriaceae bacterium]|nr:hypothetical protein [Cyclobacteriaceae bacterium]
MKGSPKNVPRPVIATRQQNGIDYMFLAILLLYLIVFLGTLQCRAAKSDEVGSTTGVVMVGHAAICGAGNQGNSIAEG